MTEPVSLRGAVMTATRNLSAAQLEVRSAVDDMVDLVRQHLRYVTPWRLKELKSALRKFDAHKREWKR